MQAFSVPSEIVVKAESAAEARDTADRLEALLKEQPGVFAAWLKSPIDLPEFIGA